MVTNTDENSVELSCEMKAFIRPDSFFIWEGPGGQIVNGTSKHQITFTSGLPLEAVDDGSLVPSRVSTLTIFNPEPSDAGTYTCSVVGTNQAVTIELLVNGTNTPSLSNTDVTVTIVGSVTAVTGLLTIATVATLCFLRCAHKRRLSRGLSNDPAYYDYPMSSIPGLNDDHQSDNNVATSNNDWIGRNEAYGVATDTVEFVEKNEAYGVAADGVEYMEKNEAYGVATDGVSAMERNVAYGVAADILY